MKIFTKIINREIPADIVYEDDQCLAFRDNHPQAPVHLLLIPKKEIPSLADLSGVDKDLMGHLMVTAAVIAKGQGLNESGYRLVINNGISAGQTVFHLHIHILGGRELDWPPG